MIKNILSQIGTLASLIGLVYTLKSDEENLNGFQWFLLFISFSLFGISIYWIIKEHLSHQPKVFNNRTDIRNYMYSWINNGGRVVIFTRDLSWVNDDEMKTLLKNKSEINECIICLPSRIDKVIEFEEAGATIIEYSKLNYVPLSRFTITNYGRDDAKIAVGKSIENGKHIIEQFGNGEHPYFQVANDLVKILEISTHD